MSKELEYAISTGLIVLGLYLYWQSWKGYERPKFSKIDWETRELSEGERRVYKWGNDLFEMGKQAVWFLTSLLFFSTLYFYFTAKEIGKEVDQVTYLVGLLTFGHLGAFLFVATRLNNKLKREMNVSSEGYTQPQDPRPMEVQKKGRYGEWLIIGGSLYLLYLLQMNP